MKILAPLNHTDDIEDFVKAGADELYIGFDDPKWYEQFGEYSDINRMSGFRHQANRYRFDEMIGAVEKIKSCGVSAFVTLNANCYGKQETEYMKEHYFPKLKAVGVDGLIVSDIRMAKEVVAYGFNAVASTMCAIYNSDTAKFYQSIGIQRMIVPRDLSLSEIQGIIQSVPSVKFEAFFMRNGCIFSDSYCLGLHRPECGATCTFLRGHPKQMYTLYDDFQNLHDINVNDYLYTKMFHNEACGMCALYRLLQIGVHSLKVVGRADKRCGLIDDISLTKRNLEIAENSQSEEAYLKNMILPSRHTRMCALGMNCYYPEVRFGKRSDGFA